MRMGTMPSASRQASSRGASAAHSRLKIALILHCRSGSRGSVLLVALLIAFGLVVAAAGTVWLLQGGNLGAIFGGDANSAQSVAEAGADQIIGVWNDPENHRLLVSGDAAPSTWTTTNQTSPCLSSSNTRPGSNSGNPSTAALNLVDGNFRNMDNITQTATGDRQFRLKAIRYSTGSLGSSDRRTISRTYAVGNGTATTTTGTIPTGKTFRDLINVDDPDGTGTLTAGTNTGYIAVEVESRVFRNGRQVGTATVTKEYQVLPKCCGGSFGSNNTGGKNFAGSGSLGSDSRYCGVDFGMIVGINGGKFWTKSPNDKYNTIDPSTGNEVQLKNILGVVIDPSYKFERNAASADSGNGCRVIPGPCSTTSDQYFPDPNANDYNIYYGAGGYASWYNASGTTNGGSQSDKDGNSASGVPITPLYINGGLPTVASRFAYTWTASGRPKTLFDTSSPGPTFTSTGTSYELRLRTRNDTTANNNYPSVPVVELCADSSYYASCTSSPTNTWAQISLPSGTATGTLTIGDDFSNNFSGTTSSLACTASNSAQCNVNRWPSIWVENDTASGGAGVGAGNVLVGSQKATLKYVSGAPTWSTVTNRAAIARVVNLLALQSPYFSFTQTVTGLSGSTATLEVSYSTTNAAINTDTGWTQLMTTTASGGVTGTSASCTLASGTYTCRVAIPAAAQTPFTTIRLRANSAYSTSQSVAIASVNITNSSGAAVSIDNWCEYSSTFPVTAQFTGGFHCLGPKLDFSLGGNFIVDTSGGSLSFYYNSPTDTRSTSLSTALINMANGAELRHVNCPNTSPASTIPPTVKVTATDNCTTNIPLTVYSAAGENDMLNIFGRDNSPSGTTMQWIRIGSKSSSTGKITGVFIYMPWGALYFIADQCVNSSDPVASSYNFAGRVWVRYLIPCGSNWFVTPPSSAVNLSALGVNSNVSFNDRNFVGWTGSDWQASVSTATRINGSL